MGQAGRQAVAHVKLMIIKGVWGDRAGKQAVAHVSLDMATH